METNLSKTYQPKEFEERIYENWLKSGSFRAVPDKAKKPFAIVMPPPNITGQLHMGHALDQTLQDVLTRWKRMQGYCALWLPGTDHASIATELKVADEILASEGKSKDEIGREGFLERAWEWKRLYGGKISLQMRKLGNSCDWERERFTMDEGCNKAVREYFVRLYEKGLIYRGNRLVNWCPSCGTTLSDIEVEHEEKNGTYWYFRYPGVDGGEGITVATSRPETMFADVAIAVHPDDGRYSGMIGQKVFIPLTGREIPIIADIYPDPEKGTGAVKITPAHDQNDFEVGERHGLPRPSCIDKKAAMTGLAGKYEGMDRYACRKAWVKELEEGGYLVKAEEKLIPIGSCYRCDTVIEPLLSDQWFVKMKDLAGPAIQAARGGDLRHVPDRFEKIYIHWLEEIRDWCVSRQLWWGHRVPAYYCGQCGEVTVSAEAPGQCAHCGAAELQQDNDVLDTWFSSALWPFSTLGWPEKTEELEYFYPTDVLVTGYDIIFFWVVRMVFSGMEVMGETPFRHVYVHGLVRDSDGRKMSKSLGNGIDPLEIIDHYGADALRFMLIAGTSPGNDMRFQKDKLEGARNFANKLWNASRFVIMNLLDEDGGFRPLADISSGGAALKDEDMWILAKAGEAIDEITRNMEKFELSLAAQKIYELIWSEYCDWYIELVKGRLYGGDEADQAVARAVLVKVLKDMLKLLHPFMPFITEEIWSFLPADGASAAALTAAAAGTTAAAGTSASAAASGTAAAGTAAQALLINAAWPSSETGAEWLAAGARLEKAMEAIRSIRNLRAEAEAAPAKKLKAFIMPSEGAAEAFAREEAHIKSLAGLASVTYINSREEAPADAASAVTGSAEIFIPLDELLDYKAEFDRLTKEKTKLEGEIARIGAKLANEGFVKKAPENVVEAERARLANYEEMAAKIGERLAMVEKKLI
ncbi:MAG: valine--tRNA ligase [Clostridiales Family XIII bacterium]|jgi:valyl-tRNA synthetase|nr:valine--tRNA ligase [Clostridiales Family XIII bacterium]